jgi:hypothetical protein
MAESFAREEIPSIWITLALIVAATIAGIGASAMDRLVGSSAHASSSADAADPARRRDCNH